MPEPEPDPGVATGDRREDVHFETRDNGEVRVAHLKKPTGPLPQHMTAVGGPALPSGVPVEDVAVAPDGPSVWDARPAEDETGG